MKHFETLLPPELQCYCCFLSSKYRVQRIYYQKRFTFLKTIVKWINDPHFFPGQGFMTTLIPGEIWGIMSESGSPGNYPICSANIQESIIVSLAIFWRYASSLEMNSSYQSSHPIHHHHFRLYTSELLRFQNLHQRGFLKIVEKLRAHIRVVVDDRVFVFLYKVV